ncbi:MAG: hypothetical protein IT365_28390 [Candidatus Hydrogenedentes bacterium]|nr:hypothetical protein [Candidatus Hydrogenedentota bacterium]
MKDEAPVERILGYDVRSVSAAWGEAWPPERREMYLLRDIGAQPRSVDRMVWPRPDVAADAEPDTEKTAHYDWIGPCDYWENLAAMRRWMKDRAVDPPAMIAVSVLFSALDDESLRAWNRIIFDPARGAWLNFWKHHCAEPDSPGSDWTRLGFDVADLGGSVSGLMNCGYSAADRVVVAEFGPLLNEWHLFDDAEDAQRFRARTDARVPEHAPFFVYGLWRIPDDSDI